MSYRTNHSTGTWLNISHIANSPCVMRFITLNGLFQLLQQIMQCTYYSGFMTASNREYKCELSSTTSHEWEWPRCRARHVGTVLNFYESKKEEKRGGLSRSSQLSPRESKRSRMGVTTSTVWCLQGLRREHMSRWRNQNDGTKEFLEIKVLFSFTVQTCLDCSVCFVCLQSQGRVKAPIFNQHLIKAQGYVT
jgi:hypothetical protein